LIYFTGTYELKFTLPISQPRLFSIGFIACCSESLGFRQVPAGLGISHFKEIEIRKRLDLRTQISVGYRGLIKQYYSDNGEPGKPLHHWHKIFQLLKTGW
jgi:hypothetical protein